MLNNSFIFYYFMYFCIAFAVILEVIAEEAKPPTILVAPERAACPAPATIEAPFIEAKLPIAPAIEAPAPLIIVPAAVVVNDTY